MYSDHSFPESSEVSEPIIYSLQIVIKQKKIESYCKVNKIHSYPKIFSDL